MISATQMRLKTAPETAPSDTEILEILSVADLKAESRRIDSSEDARFQDAIEAAYIYLDGPNGYLNRAILSQQWIGYLDEFDTQIELPIPPLSSVDLFEYRDTDGNWQTLATTVYAVDVNDLFGMVYLKKDQSWPHLYDERGSIRITFTAGMTDGAAVIAEGSILRNVRKALKLLAGHFFYNPTPTFVEPRLVEVPRKVQYS